MNIDPGILCFQHCGPKIFCFKFPRVCPNCNKELIEANFNGLPFRIPCPFVTASQHPCSIVMKPTAGDFLNDYFNSMNLHIGVTTSQGIVVEFDKNGLHQGNTFWNECLVLDGVSKPWSDHWDSTLRQICASNETWTAQKYDEESFNCYNFVLAFLCELKHSKLSQTASNRTLFCETFIVPRAVAAGKYISLYRKLRKNDCVIYNSPMDNLNQLVI